MRGRAAKQLMHHLHKLQSTSIGQLIPDELAFAARRHQAFSAQHTQLLLQGRLGNACQLLQLRHCALL